MNKQVNATAPYTEEISEPTLLLRGRRLSCRSSAFFQSNHFKTPCNYFCKVTSTMADLRQPLQYF